MIALGVALAALLYVAVAMHLSRQAWVAKEVRYRRKEQAFEWWHGYCCDAKKKRPGIEPREYSLYGSMYGRCDCMWPYIRALFWPLAVPTQTVIGGARRYLMPTIPIPDPKRIKELEDLL